MQPDRTLPDMEPMSRWLRLTARDAGLVFRVGAPLFLVTTFGALLAWGYTGGESASVPRIPKERCRLLLRKCK